MDRERIEKFIEERTRNSGEAISSCKLEIEKVRHEQIPEERRHAVIDALNKRIQQEIGYQMCLRDLKFVQIQNV